MKAVVFLFMAVVACSAAAPQLHGDDLDAIWEMFKKVHSKHYHCWRKTFFQERVAEISIHNQEYNLGRHTFSMGINEYSDMSEEEFSRTMSGLRYNSSATRFAQPLAANDCNVSSLPTNVDWREKGFVTPVKNQGKCRSDYAFSATGSLEGQMFKKTGKLVSLSAKNIVDCSRRQGNEGCKGGLVDIAFTYIKRNGGIDTEVSYPYIPQAGECQFERENIGGVVVGLVDVIRTENCLQEAVATIGPISAGVFRSKRFQGYKDGVFDDAACFRERPDHAVLVVGYGTTKRGKPYWLLKNSWGQSWGIDGYMKLARNSHSMCAIAYMPSYPLAPRL